MSTDRKRSKACIHCRKAKVKCIKTTEIPTKDSPCNRCILHGLECGYEIKVPEYKPAVIRENKRPLAETSTGPNLAPRPPPLPSSVWKSSIEQRLDGLGSQLVSLIDIININDSSQVSVKKAKINDLGESLLKISSNLNSPPIEEPPSPPKNDENTDYYNDPLFPSYTSAKQLFVFFNQNISPQLFGFDISKFSFDLIWNSCPLLVVAVSCIASIHHPNLNHLSSSLEKLIYKISSKLLYTYPTNHLQAFNTIIALIMCAFWFKNNQLFTGLALQIANSFNLLHSNKFKNISKSDRLKLWYLLYILDSQQSLVFNTQTLFNNDDSTILNSKQLLSKKESDDPKDAAIIPLPLDIRLLSQLEYHHAINAAFSGNAWDLLSPNNFGLPFKTNLQLDKWMVQWTILLNPFKNIPIWSSKSTLIYYNFAKMYINSFSIRNLETLNNLPSLNDFSNDGIEDGEEDDNENDEDDDDDGSSSNDDETIATLSPKQSHRVALSAAETILNLVVNDHDILNNLKYVPIHIHIMLYYAALLILKHNINATTDSETTFTDSIKYINLVKKLKISILNNKPIDKQFSRNLISRLDSIIVDKINTLRSVFTSPKQLEILQSIQNTNNHDMHHSEGSKQRISAWPGLDASHPFKKVD